MLLRTVELLTKEFILKAKSYFNPVGTKSTNYDLLIPKGDNFVENLSRQKILTHRFHSHMIKPWTPE